MVSSVPPATQDTPRPVQVEWRRPMIQNTLLVAVGITVFDALLLQRKKAFFTGGFLSSFHVDGPLQAAGFLSASLLTDAGIAVMLVTAALWLTGRFMLTPRARNAAVLMLAAGPLLVADFVMYQLVTYLGDAFDLSLMFDLTGRQPGEFLAVSSQHLIGPSILLIAGGIVAFGIVRAVNRLGPAGRASRLRLPIRAFVLASGMFVVAGVASALVRASSETFEDGLRRKPGGSLFVSLTELATDADRDGFGVGGRMSDPDPFDAGIFPYAVDIPGDGIDQNGVAGDLPADTAAYAETPAITAPWVHRPDVVLIVLESFRADAIGRTVNGKPVTPVLDELARQGVSVPLAFSHNGYTAESRFHIFSGSIAGVRDGQSIIDDFKANGYEVAYFSGQDDSFGGAAYGVGMERADVAYDAKQDRDLRYSTFTTAGSLAVPHEIVQQRIASFLRARDRGKPLFLYVNFHDTHYPYHHPSMRPLVSDRVVAEGDIHPSRASALHEMYFNAAANVDAAIGATLEMVRGHLTAPPAVIVTADHGESLFDEGFLGHGYGLNDVQTRIPLIVSGIGLDVEQPFGQVELRDLIASALADGDRTDRPSVGTRAGKDVFQYLGTLSRPRQIGLVTAEGRTIFDFRTNRVRLGEGPWQRPDALDEAGAARFVGLVRMWERMMVARSTAPGSRMSEER